jgi:hypothetical protein
LSNFYLPESGIFSFFLALIKTKSDSDFNKLPKIDTFLKYEAKTALRNLPDEEYLYSQLVNVNCSLKSGNSQSLAGGFHCSGNGNNAYGIELDENTLIAGLPESEALNLNDSKPISKDYSDPKNLYYINKLPSVTINKNGIEESACEAFGDYTIKGKVKGEGLNDANGVLIPFSYPDSTGLCDIEVNGSDITMKCHNKEEFQASQILFEQTIIQDSNGTEIFILNSYTNQKSFACAISINSVKSPDTKNNNSTDTSIASSSSSSSNQIGNSNAYKYFNNKDSSGLKGGAIVGMIITIIAALAIVTGLAIYCKGKNAKDPMRNSKSEYFYILTNTQSPKKI